MDIPITVQQLIPLNINPEKADLLLNHFKAQYAICTTAASVWEEMRPFLLAHRFSFEVHLFIFQAIFPNWPMHPDLAPVWSPSALFIPTTNLNQCLTEVKLPDVKRFHEWSYTQYAAYWTMMLKKLAICFQKQPEAIVDLSNGMETPRWFPGAQLNIAESCFSAPPHETAMIEIDNEKKLHTVSYHELNELSNSIANSLAKQGFQKGDAIAIMMPLNRYAVAIYLGIIKMGGIVVSIADSFSTQEISTRLNIAKAKAIFTQDWIHWDNKTLPLYEKITAPIPCIVIKTMEKTNVSLRKEDVTWDTFLIHDPHFSIVPCQPMDPCHILFSSGTTAEPKAIIWNHTTPIKSAADAFLHQNIKANDVLAWPTNLGWMMGPWLVFAALVNKATLALYTDSPKHKAFGEFVEKTKVTMLGVVPTLVSSWRQSKCMEDLDWSQIKVLSSTGECSNPEDMFYLMYLADYKPIIEYCGGTEIGGAYVSSTVIEDNYPSLFSTPTMGLNFIILDEEGKKTSVGEVAINTISLGLSTQLLNADHHQIYFKDMPKSESNYLRRHGDLIQQFPNGYYALLGRSDDAMNLGGIKVSAAEIERVLVGFEGIEEIAAIAVPSHHLGPNQLIIVVVSKAEVNKASLQKEMQLSINRNLNPLFKIADIYFIDSLPKTASNKIMRRTLRKRYQEKMKIHH